MNQKHLLRFIKKKVKACPLEKVLERDGKALTLEEVRYLLRYDYFSTVCLYTANHDISFV